MCDTLPLGGIGLRQDPLEAILVIFGRRALFFLFKSSWKNMENDTTFVRMRSGDHLKLGDAKMSKKGTSLRRSLIATDRNGFCRMKEEGQIYKTNYYFFSSCNLSTPACNASGLQTFHPKLCEASSVVVLPLMKPHKVWGETFGDQKRHRLSRVLRLHEE